MDYFSRSLFLLITLLTSVCPLAAQEWRDKTEQLIYSPRYFGPNAFPIPELRSGKAGSRYEVELRGEYHYYRGDQTKDLYARAFLPLIKGRAGLEVSLVIVEDYVLTPETRDERFAVETESPITCHGDIILTSFFQLLTSEKWVDAMLSINLKTASGGRLCDARYTDAASYWIDLTVGKYILRPAANNLSVRVQAMGGFYCWMTNDLIHRQNDALSYGAGLTGTYRGFSLSSNLAGFYGYKDNGDRPLIWRNVLNYELKKNILSARYHHGMKDRLYESYSLAYIRCF